MLKVIRMIKEAKVASGLPSQDVAIDLHPVRPEYRGFLAGRTSTAISLEADPTFEEIEAAGGTVEKSDATHTVLDDMFLISGEIPRNTSYETGMRNGIQWMNGAWIPDELITDERLVMCNVKSASLLLPLCLN